MTDTSMVPGKRDGGPPPRPALVDEQLADQLLGKAQAEGVELLGPDGLLSQVTKAVLERALAEPLRWRKPRTVFVNSVSVGHARVPRSFAAQMWAVMALAERHTFQVRPPPVIGYRGGPCSDDAAGPRFVFRARRLLVLVMCWASGPPFCACVCQLTVVRAVSAMAGW